MNGTPRRRVLQALIAIGGASALGVPAVHAATEALVVTTYGGSWEAFWRDTLIAAIRDGDADHAREVTERMVREAWKDLRAHLTTLIPERGDEA